MHVFAKTYLLCNMSTYVHIVKLKYIYVYILVFDEHVCISMNFLHIQKYFVVSKQNGMGPWQFIVYSSLLRGSGVSLILRQAQMGQQDNRWNSVVLYSLRAQVPRTLMENCVLFLYVWLLVIVVDVYFGCCWGWWLLGFTKSMFCVSGFGLLFSCWALRDHLYGPKFFWKVSKLSPVRYRFTTTIKFGVFPHWKTMAIFSCHFQGANDKKPLLVSLREFLWNVPPRLILIAHHRPMKKRTETQTGGWENPTVGWLRQPGRAPKTYTTLGQI